MLQPDHLRLSGTTKCSLRGTEATSPFGFSGLTGVCTSEGTTVEGRLPVNHYAESHAERLDLYSSHCNTFSQALCCAPITPIQKRSHLEGATPKQCGLKPVRVVWSQGTHYSAIQVLISKFWLGQHFASAISPTLLIQSPEQRNPGFWVSLF